LQIGKELGWSVSDGGDDWVGFPTELGHLSCLGFWLLQGRWPWQSRTNCEVFCSRFSYHCNESYNALFMRACCEPRSTTELLALHDQVVELGFVPNGETCRSIIYGLSKSSG
jgi:hypothetical protein